MQRALIGCYHVRFLSHRVRYISDISNESLSSCAFPAAAWHLGAALGIQSHTSARLGSSRQHAGLSNNAVQRVEEEDGVMDKSEGCSEQVLAQRRVKDANLSESPFPDW